MEAIHAQVLAGKVALVTGGARRIGSVLALALHGAGAGIVLHYRSSEASARELAEALNAARPGSAALARADLLDEHAPEQLIAAARASFGRLDILVNNASTFYPTPVGEISTQSWNDLLGTNLKAPLFLAQAAAPLLVEARGLILNLVDIHGLRPLRRYTTYSVAKAALIMLTKSLARELAPHVRVNAVAPGPVLWPDDADLELREEIVSRTLLKRAGSPADVARAVLYFATEAPYVTGQILAVDGGRSLGW
jgi:pteridine reductase